MKKYLITAATAFALGAGTMQVADLGDSVATHAMAQSEALGVVIPPGQPLTKLETDLFKIVCPLVEAHWGKDAPCDSTTVRQVHFFWDDQDAKGSIVVKAQVELPGEWAPANKAKGGSK